MVDGKGKLFTRLYDKSGDFTVITLVPYYFDLHRI